MEKSIHDSLEEEFLEKILGTFGGIPTRIHVENLENS